jgi:hypothetical protein
MDRIRILIADDHPVFRFGLRALLTAEPTTEVVGRPLPEKKLFGWQESFCRRSS